MADWPVRGQQAPDYWDTTLRGYVDDIGSRVDGFTNHGEVDGDVTFSGPVASHWFTATGPTTITLDYEEGQVVSMLCFGGGADVAVDGLPSLVFTDGQILTLMYAQGAWYGGGGSGDTSADSTPPSGVTGLEAVGGEGSLSASWSPATDDESTVHYKYRYWLTSGGASGAWTTASGTSFDVPSLPAGAYTVQVYSYSTGGQSAPVSDTTTVTPPAGWNAILSDSFTGSDGTIAGHVPQVSPDGSAWATGASPDILVIESNRVSQPDSAYNPGGVLAIPSHTTSLGVSADFEFHEIGDSSQPGASLIMKSPSNNEDLTLTLMRQAGGTITITASAGNGGGAIALTGVTTGHPDTARYGFRWRSDRSISVLVDGVQVATGTTAVPTYARDFTEVRIGTLAFKASYFDNFTVEDYT